MIDIIPIGDKEKFFNLFKKNTLTSFIEINNSGGFRFFY